MTRPDTRRRRGTLALITAPLLFALAGCGTASGPATGTDEPSAGTGSGFPVTIDNCGDPVTLDAAPERIILVNSDALADIEALGAVDRIVGITSEPAPGLYDPTTYEALDALALMSTEKNATGGSVVSQESLLGANPDLVVAPANAIDRAALERAGVAVYTPPAYCATSPYSGPASFDRVWSDLTDLGALLGESDRAAEVTAELRESVASAASDRGTAAAIYVSSGGTVLSPYGAQSMVTPVFAAAGLENVYADIDERVFDVNAEDLSARNPETVVVLYSSGEPQDAVDAFLSAPGVLSMSAVREGRVIPLLFPYTDPPSVLSVQGPAQLDALLADIR